MAEDDLERLAREALLRDAARGSERSSTMGPTGWLKCPVAPTNKRFLHNTIMSSLHSDRRAQHRQSDIKRRKRSSSPDTGRKNSRKDSDHHGYTEKSASNTKHRYHKSSEHKRTKEESDLNTDSSPRNEKTRKLDTVTKLDKKQSRYDIANEYSKNESSRKISHKREKTKDERSRNKQDR